MKKSIFDEQTSKALMNWRMAAVKKKRGGGSTGGNSPIRTLETPFSPGPTTPPSMMSQSTGATLHHPKTTTTTAFSPPSPESSATHLINVRVDHQNGDMIKPSIPQRDYTKNEEDFSFDKPSTKY